MNTVLLPISVVIITKNESAKIEACIQSVKSFASEIIVVDSHSTDDTVKKAQNLGAKVVLDYFKGFGQQKNLAHSLATQEWILNLDADERVSETLVQELKSWFLQDGKNYLKLAKMNGFYLPRKTWYLNRWVMHGGWYPNYLMRLARKTKSKWTEPSLHESLSVDGEVEYLKHPLLHYSFNDQRAHILKNVEYAEFAKKGLIERKKTARCIDLIKPIWKFIDIYFIKRGFLDGMAGFLIAIHSAYALFLRYAYLYEEKVRKEKSAEQ